MLLFEILFGVFLHLFSKELNVTNGFMVTWGTRATVWNPGGLDYKSIFN